MLAGACEDLLTPRALGPLRDAARSAAGGPLAAALSPQVDPDLVFAAVCDELAAPPSPAVLVVEDVHWADGATLDVLRYLGTRVQGLPAVLLMTYRDDALARDHPLRGVLGTLGSTAASRLRLSSSPRSAVRAMAEPTSLDPGELFELTGGNPFYVSEVLADPARDGAPNRARGRGTGPGAHPEPGGADGAGPAGRHTVRAEVDLLRVLVGDLAPVAEAERAGVVEVRGALVAFRHELARRAVAESLPASVRLDLNADVLCALLTAPDGDPFPVFRITRSGRRQRRRLGARRGGGAEEIPRRRAPAGGGLLRPGAGARAPAADGPAGSLGEAYSWALSNSNQLHFAVAAAATAAELWQQEGDDLRLVRALVTSPGSSG